MADVFFMSNKIAYQEYLSWEKKYSPHTILAYMNDLESFESYLGEAFKGMTLEEVSYSIVRSWIVFLIDSGINSTSVNRKVAALKSFYKFLLKVGAITVSPLLPHKALKTPRKIQVPFSEYEMQRLLDELAFEDGFSGVRDKLIIELFYSTGIRRAELIELKVTDVNPPLIKVLGKRNKERIVPILPVVEPQILQYLELRAAITDIKDQHHFFISEKGVKLNESFVYRMINNYFSRVSEKLKKSPHVLRHTYATHMLNNGADLNSVKELLGHSSLASTQVYTHSSLAALQKVHEVHPRNQQ